MECLIQARIAVIAVVFVWATVLSFLSRRASNVAISKLARFLQALVSVGVSVTIFFVGEAFIQDPAKLSSFAPASVAECVVEWWSAHWIMVGCSIIITMYLGVKPLILGHQRGAHNRKPFVTVAGITLGVICVALLSLAAVPGPSLIIVVPVIALIVALLRIFGSRDQPHVARHTFQRAFFAVLGVAWPTIIMPAASVVTVVLNVSVFLLTLVILYRTVTPPRLSSSARNETSNNRQWRRLEEYVHGRGKTLREATASDQWAQCDEDEYVNSKHGLRIECLNDWMLQDFAEEFRCAGGFLALDSPDSSAGINISSGPTGIASGPRDAFLCAWEAHALSSFEQIRRKFGGASIERIEFPELDGETEVLRLEFSASEARFGKLCALHQGDEYVVHYTVNEGSAVDVEKILRSWKWRPRLRADLTGLGGGSA